MLIGLELLEAADIIRTVVEKKGIRPRYGCEGSKGYCNLM
jgi:hypothetical protein